MADLTLFRADNHIAQIRIDLADASVNTLQEAAIAQMTALLDELEQDKTVKGLVIYSGNLIGEIERPDSSRAIPTCFEGGNESGMACVKEWTETSSEGAVLRGALRDMHRGRDSWPRRRW